MEATVRTIEGERARGHRTADPTLAVRDVTLRFAGVTALDSVSLDVWPGEIAAIIGPNGAGKSSLFNCISGFYVPGTGTVSLGGTPLVGRRPHEIAAMGLGRMFQNIQLFDQLSVVENLMLGRHPHLHYSLLNAVVRGRRTRTEEHRSREVVEDIIEFLEIETWRRTPAGLLPYGIQKRVELGRALALSPKVLLLDEPVAGMNAEETEDMARFVLDVQEQLGIAILLVEHDMGLVMDLADQVTVLDFGRVIASGHPHEVQRDPAVVRAYLGDGEGMT